MQELIASYLFQNKACPLPGLGSLSINTSAAESDITNQKISAPQAVILFKNKETDPAGLLNYVAVQTDCHMDEASETLDHFCNDLKKEISNHTNAKLDGIGDLFIDSNGHINLKPAALPVSFLPAVFAERVIHPKAEHSILVGDKETTNTAMSEYFTEEPEVKDYWWLWAIVLAVIALGAMVFYFANPNSDSLFGNSIKI
jgi:nucleoid DNA-binding protein